MSGRIDWNIVTLGRVLGIAIILVGVGVAALDASAFNLSGSHGAGSYFRLRYFLGNSIGFLWKGGLVFAGAEIADRFGWGDGSSIDWHGTRLLRVLGVTVAASTIGVTTWNLLVVDAISTSTVARTIMHSVIGSFWSGGMLILAAELADRIGWRGGDTQETVSELPA